MKKVIAAAALLASLCVVAVAQGTVVQEVAKQTLTQVAIDDGDFYRPLAAIYKKNKTLSPAMKQFLAILKESP